MSKTDRDGGFWEFLNTDGTSAMTCVPGVCPQNPQFDAPDGYDPVCCTLNSQKELYRAINRGGNAPLPVKFTAGSSSSFNFDEGYDQPRVEDKLYIDQGRQISVLRDEDLTLDALEALGIGTGVYVAGAVGKEYIPPYLRDRWTDLNDALDARQAYIDTKDYIDMMKAHQDLQRNPQPQQQRALGGPDDLNRPLLGEPAASTSIRQQVQDGMRSRVENFKGGVRRVAGDRRTPNAAQRVEALDPAQPFPRMDRPVSMELLPQFLQARDQAQQGEPITVDIPSWMDSRIQNMSRSRPVDTLNSRVARQIDRFEWNQAPGNLEFRVRNAEINRLIGRAAGVPVDPRSPYIQDMAHAPDVFPGVERMGERSEAENDQRNTAWEEMSIGTRRQRMEALSRERQRVEALRGSEQFDQGYLNALDLVGNPEANPGGLSDPEQVPGWAKVTGSQRNADTARWARTMPEFSSASVLTKAYGADSTAGRTRAQILALPDDVVRDIAHNTMRPFERPGQQAVDRVQLRGAE
jgi:hypothetical protein